MATITFLSAVEASKYTNIKQTPINNVFPEVECLENQDGQYDVGEFNFFEAAPVSVSAIPEDAGLTLSDLLLDESPIDDDIQILKEINPYVTEQISSDFEKVENSAYLRKEKIHSDLEKYISIAKGDPDISISRASFEQVLNTKPPKTLELKNNNITKLIENIHKENNLQPIVLIKKINVPKLQNYADHHIINEFKTEPTDELNISEEVVDELFFDTWSRHDKSFMESNNDDFVYDFYVNGESPCREDYRIKSILNQLLSEQRHEILEEREFTLTGLFPKKFNSLDNSNFSKIKKFCTICGQRTQSNDIYCYECKETFISAPIVLPKKNKAKLFSCNYCDYLVEDSKILDQHYIIHGKIKSEKYSDKLLKPNHCSNVSTKMNVIHKKGKNSKELPKSEDNTKVCNAKSSHERLKMDNYSAETYKSDRATNVSTKINERKNRNKIKRKVYRLRCRK